MRVLIADDELTQRRFLAALLRRAGHDVVEAADGCEAWAVIESERPRLVLSDWLMPGLTGPELVRRVRAAGWPGYTYVILLTAKEGKESLVAGLEAGADDYLTKPFDRAELMARLAIGLRILDLEQRLADAATHDPLTGLLNRRAVHERVSREEARARREKSPVAVALFDIDHFKRVNDRFGHAAGDEVLRVVGRLVAADVRPYDLAARWGGEEFLLVLPGADAAAALATAERLRRRIETAEVRLPDGPLPVTISGGVAAAVPDEGIVFDALVARADSALYRAKEEGRNRVREG